jgi:hypothetical protein
VLVFNRELLRRRLEEEGVRTGRLPDQRDVLAARRRRDLLEGLHEGLVTELAAELDMA